MDKVTQEVVGTIREYTREHAGAYSQWQEADGMVEYMIRPDGKVLGLEDYQEIGVGEASLEDLSRRELGKILSGLEPWKQADQDREEEPCPLAAVEWMHGAAYTPGTQVVFSGMDAADYRTPVCLAKQLKWREHGGSIKTLPKGARLNAHVTDDEACVALENHLGMSLIMPGSSIVPLARKATAAETETEKKTNARHACYRNAG